MTHEKKIYPKIVSGVLVFVSMFVLCYLLFTYNIQFISIYGLMPKGYFSAFYVRTR